MLLTCISIFLNWRCNRWHREPAHAVQHHPVLPVLCIPGFGKQYHVTHFTDSESRRMRPCCSPCGWILGWTPSALTLEKIISTLLLSTLFLFILGNFTHVYKWNMKYAASHYHFCPPVLPIPFHVPMFLSPFSSFLLLYSSPSLPPSFPSFPSS